MTLYEMIDVRAGKAARGHGRANFENVDAFGRRTAAKGKQLTEKVERSVPITAVTRRAGIPVLNAAQTDA
ncbi:hypothetical protein [Shinella sp.]|uniref:hypothetical protein n=1 Tax=Shinella sp. TaxID=1870904 RepID=UPI003F707498